MAAALSELHILFFVLVYILTTFFKVEGASWCVARSDASSQALQTAMDYACGAGADCTPLDSNGLCFLPNTLQAHASYAFNSFYQRKAMAPGSCDFSATATVAKTDPSYGSCVYPSSLSTAGGNVTSTTTPPTTTTTTTPITTNPTPSTGTPSGNGGGLTPGFTNSNSNNSNSCLELSVGTILMFVSCYYLFYCFLNLQPM